MSLVLHPQFYMIFVLAKMAISVTFCPTNVSGMVVDLVRNEGEK